MLARSHTSSAAAVIALSAGLALSPAAAHADYEPLGFVQDPYTDEDDARGLCVNGTAVYMISDEPGTQQLNVYDASGLDWGSADFTTPVTSLSTGSYDYGVRCVGDALYAHGSGGIQVYDVTSPLAPSAAGSIALGSVYTLVPVGGNLVATGAFGAIVYSLANPLAPTELDSYPLPDANQRAYAGTVVGTDLYLGVYDFGTSSASIVHLDFSNPSDLGTPTSTAAPEFLHHMEPVGDELLTLSDSTARLYDLSTPASPSEVDAVAALGRALSRQGDVLFVRGMAFQVVESHGSGSEIVELDTYPVQVATSGLPHRGDALGDFVFTMGSAGAVILGDFRFVDGFETADTAGWNSTVPAP